jgi:uncharacterized protein YjgD (DUF1641 family)
MKLTETEKIKINTFLSKYKEIHSQLDITLKKVDILLQEKDSLLDDLINTRKEEESFKNELIEKYGEGVFDIETLEYKIN